MPFTTLQNKKIFGCRFHCTALHCKISCFASLTQNGTVFNYSCIIFLLLFAVAHITFLRLLGILLWSPMSFIGVLLSYNLVIIVCITAPNFYSTAHLFFLDVVNNIILWICGQIFSKPQLWFAKPQLWFATIWTCIIEKGLTYGSNIQILEPPLNFSRRSNWDKEVHGCIMSLF